MTDPNDQLSIDEELEPFGDWLRRVSQGGTVLWRDDMLVPRHSVSPEDCRIPLSDRDPVDETDEPE